MGRLKTGCPAVNDRWWDTSQETVDVTGGTGGPRGGKAARDGREYPGGTPAPVSATYETVNLFGSVTGHRVVVQQGDILPALPRGFTWVIVER
jgi:hypothetical protein